MKYDNFKVGDWVKFKHWIPPYTIYRGVIEVINHDTNYVRVKATKTNNSSNLYSMEVTDLIPLTKLERVLK